MSKRRTTDANDTAQTPRIGVVSARETKQQPGDGGLDFSTVWMTLREGKWIVLATTLVITAVIALYTFIVDPVYESSSLVLVEVSAEQGPKMTSFQLTEQHVLANEIGILENSIDLAVRVADKIGETADAVDKEDSFPILLDADGQRRASAAVALDLLDRVEFSSLPEQDLIQIRAESPVREEAAVIANQYAEQYVSFTREQARKSVTAARKFLQDQVTKRREELDGLEQRWATFARQQEVVSVGAQGERLVEEVATLETMRDNAQFQLEQEESALEFMRAEIQRVEPGLARDLEANRDVAALEEEVSALDRQIAQLRIQAEQYYAINGDELRGNEERIPELAEIVRQIDHFSEKRSRLSQQLIDETIKTGGASAMSAAANGGLDGRGQLGYLGQLKARLAEKQMVVRELREQINTLDRKISQYGGRLETIPKQTIELRQLERKRAVVEQWYTTFMQELQRTMIAEESELGYVKIIRSALVPSLPVRPSVKQNLLLGLLLGLGFGIGFAFAKQASNNRLRRPDDVRSEGFSLVGVIPTMRYVIKQNFGGQKTIDVDGRERSTSLMALLDPWSTIAENYRLIRTNIDFSGLQTERPVILVTSPEMGDGKSVTAANLAIVMAQSGRKTLLLDADLRRPHAHQLLGENLRPGVAECISKDVQSINWDAFETEIPHLHFMPAGKAESPSAELVGSQAMRRLLANAKESFDCVIIDSAPVLAVTDPIILAKRCDATLVVAAADRTETDALAATRQTLEGIDAHIAGVVFNRYDAEKANHYGYGYQYGYGQDTPYNRPVAVAS